MNVEAAITVPPSSTSPLEPNDLKRPEPSATRASEKNLIEILLVEDDDADAYLIEQALAELPSIGRVVRARNGVEAVALVDSGSIVPSLALIDLQMPRMDGLQLLAELNSRTDRHFPLVVLTSSASSLDIQRAFRRHAWKYCLKKDSVYELKRSLRRVIEIMPKP